MDRFPDLRERGNERTTARKNDGTKERGGDCAMAPRDEGAMERENDGAKGRWRKDLAGDICCH
ncbi:MAG: hypothetical protein V5A47_13135 [Bacteroidales bacterium]